MNEKKYVGRGKRVGNYDLINLTIGEEKLKQHWFENMGKRYVKLTIGKKKETDQYGKTHTVWIDEYVPESKKAESNTQSAPLPTPDLPF